MPHPAVARLGFKGDEASLADSFLRSLQHWGRTEREAVDMLTMFAEKFGPRSGASWQDASLALANYAERNGWDADLQNAVHGWHSTVASNGDDPGAIRPLDRRQDPKHVEKRRGEIESTMRTSLREYFGNAQVQDEYMGLIEASQDTPLLEGPR